jgi:hypothetical protein
MDVDKILRVISVLILSIGFPVIILAQDKPAPASEAAELAKKLSNPVASLISVPFQNNTDVGIGDFNGTRNTMNIQPVIPVGLSPKLNLIGRVILPVISQHDITGEGTIQSGLSDAVISAFFSPSQTKNGLVWAVGPVFLVPIATEDLLGTEKFGTGPTALLLKQTHGWTYGALVNQIWSVAGEENRANVNQMFLQPFLVHNWKSGAGIGVNAEMTQAWEAGTNSTFINPFVSGVTKLGKQIISLSIGPRIQVSAPDGNKADFGVRAVLTFVFPKK